jgi:ubiquinone/menaquinone biosynthesis C-methylase UbiE
MDNIQVFEKFAEEYDQWFDSNRFIYESEIIALKQFVPQEGKGLEIGVGTGRFAVPLGINIGIEPARAMANIALKRGIEVCEAKAEELPFGSETFDFVLIVTTLCFLENPFRAIQEVKRVLKPGGFIIIGMIDKESQLGKIYESRKKDSKFYRFAHFHSVREVSEWLKSLKYDHIKTCQTIFKSLKDITSVEPVKKGYGEGGFVVISARKKAG